MFQIIQEKKNNELNEKTGENDVFIYPHQPSMTIYILLITIVSAIVVAVSIRLVYKDSYLKAFIDNRMFIIIFLFIYI